nr:C39 family peptidase [Enterococcus mediterraneensis]
MILKKNSLVLALIGGVLLFLMFMLVLAQPNLDENDQPPQDTSSSKAAKPEKKIQNVRMDVPLENQFDEPALGNGCEVTALSMLLRYYGYDTTKNQLAEKLDYVPVYVDNTYHGNPHDGFVGEIAGGDWAMGVAVEPIAKVAKQIAVDYQVEASTKRTFDEVLAVVSKKTPVWIKATVELEVPTDEDFMVWETTSGPVEVSPINHAVVITGIKGDTIYVNDPYGHKDREIAKEDLQKIYERMGSQSLYLKKKS